MAVLVAVVAFKLGPIHFVGLVVVSPAVIGVELLSAVLRTFVEYGFDTLLQGLSFW